MFEKRFSKSLPLKHIDLVFVTGLGAKQPTPDQMEEAMSVHGSQTSLPHK